MEEGESEWCQYTCAHNFQWKARFGSIKVWVVPPPDITLILRQEPSTTLKHALKRRGPAGVGHFIDHSCCPLHTNAELAVRWTSDTKHSCGDGCSKETNTSRGVGLGELCAGGSNAGGLGEEVLVHLLPGPGSLWRRPEAGHQLPPL
jgi:hypothetical protein